MSDFSQTVLFADYHFRAGVGGLQFSNTDYPITLEQVKWNEGDRFTCRVIDGQVCLLRDLTNEKTELRSEVLAQQDWGGVSYE